MVEMKPKYSKCDKCESLYEVPSTVSIWIVRRTIGGTYEARNFCEDCRLKLEKWLNGKAEIQEIKDGKK